MIDDVFVFDGVAHLFNFEEKNAFGPPGVMFNNHLYAFHNALTPDNEPHLPPEEFLRQWTVGDIRQMVYDESDTDTLAGVRRLGQPRPGPDDLLGVGEPAGGPQGPGPDGAAGR
jgi:hypothetical protein